MSSQLRVVTRCATMNDFLTMFRPFIEDEQIFIPTRSPRVVGRAQPFAIELAGGEIVMRGEGEVSAVHLASDGPFKRNGMWLRLLSIDTRSTAVHEELLARARRLQQPHLPLPRSGASSSMPAVVGLGAKPAPAIPFPSGKAAGEIIELEECTLYDDERSDVAPLPVAARADSDWFSAIEGAAGTTRPDVASAEPDVLGSLGGPAEDSGAVVLVPTARPPRVGLWVVMTGMVALGVGLGGGYLIWGSRQGGSGTEAAAAAGSGTGSAAGTEAAAGTAAAAAAGTAAAAAAGTGAGSAAGTATAAAAGAATAAGTATVPAGPGTASNAVADSTGSASPSESAAGSGSASAAGSGSASAAGSAAGSGSAAAAGSAAGSGSASAAGSVAGSGSGSGSVSGSSPDSGPPNASPAVSGVGGAVSHGPDTCTATIRTSPDGADVSLLNRPLGQTPLTSISIPCGDLTLTFTHSRYEDLTKTFHATPSPLDIHEQLSRPQATLDLTSSPSGATFTVSGAGSHTSPFSVKIEAFSSLHVTATLAGYKPWSQTVYARGKKLSVTAKLEPLKRH